MSPVSGMLAGFVDLTAFGLARRPRRRVGWEVPLSCFPEMQGSMVISRCRCERRRRCFRRCPNGYGSKQRSRSTRSCGNADADPQEEEFDSAQK